MSKRRSGVARNATPIPQPATPVNLTAAKCMRAFALLEEAWELIHNVLDEGDWRNKVPAAFPDEAVEPLRDAICCMRPAENYPAGTTRAEMEAAAEVQDATCH